MTPRRPWAAAAATVLALACLALNVRASLARVPEPFWDRQPVRFWQDVHLAEALYLFGEFPVRANDVVWARDAEGIPRFSELHPHLSRAATEAGLHRWQFWRTVRAGRFLRPAARVFVDRYDDSGRPVLVALGFALLGGIAPFLPFWLGFLVAVPTLAAVAAALWTAGRWAAATALVALLGAFPFLADCLSLTYSTAGFQALALIAAIPSIAYATLHPAPRVVGLVGQAAGAGVVFAVCMLARAGAALAAPAVLLALAAGAWRATGPSRPGRGRRAAGLAVLGAVVFALPYALARAAVDRRAALTASAYGRAELAPQRHAFWFGAWTGLGDFDREKGHQWLDTAASAAGVAAGGTPLRFDGYDSANEPVFRRLVLNDIEGDPAWFATILARRAFATVTQRKLWPWPPLDGRSLAPREHPNEGVIDEYYSLVTPADQLGVGPWRVELPVPLLAMPAAGVLAAAAWPRTRPRWRGAALALLALAAGALPLPVLVTTAGAIEPQSFVAVYLLGIALAIDGLLRRGGQAADGLRRDGVDPQPSSAASFSHRSTSSSRWLLPAGPTQSFKKVACSRSRPGGATTSFWLLDTKS